MQEEEKNNGMEGMSVEEMFLGVQESYQEAQLRAQEENRAFARTEFFRMDKFGTYRLAATVEYKIRQITRNSHTCT